MSAIESRRLRAFGQQVRGDARRDVCLLQKRDLEFLRAVDQTLEALDIECERIGQLTRACLEFIEQVHATQSALEKAEEIACLFEKARDGVEEAYKLLVAMRQSARMDDALCDDDGVVDAFTKTITLAADLHNSLDGLVRAILDNAADHSPVVGPFTSAEELIASLRA